MSRSTVRVVGGLVVACVAAYLIVLLGFQSGGRSFDLSWLYSSPSSGSGSDPSPESGRKQDRLPLSRNRVADEVVMAFQVPSKRLTIVAKGSMRRRIDEGALHLLRARERLSPVRDVPNESKREEQRLLEGCEPSFSPVTVPALAHVSGRCLS